MLVFGSTSAAAGSSSFTAALDHVALGFEVLGAATLVLGVPFSIVLAVLAWRRTREPQRAYNALRQAFGGALLLALEVLVAADLIRTVAVAPTLTNVLVLGLIVLIRTFLSFSLQTEIEGAPPWRRATASGVGTVSRAASKALRTERLTQAGEQVILRHSAAGRVGHPDEALPPERGLGDLRGQLAEPRILDLAGVRE
jgi:uncharacterized membrane protein